MLGVWLTTAFKNYEGLKLDQKKSDSKKETIEQKTQAGINLVENNSTETKQGSEKFPGQNRKKSSSK